jgi:hypothetical protein
MDIEQEMPERADMQRGLFEMIRQLAFAGFDGRHERQGYIALIDGRCDACSTETKVLVMDASEGEYAPGAICRTCALAAFERED